MCPMSRCVDFANQGFTVLPCQKYMSAGTNIVSDYNQYLKFVKLYERKWRKAPGRTWLSFTLKSPISSSVLPMIIRLSFGFMCMGSRNREFKPNVSHTVNVGTNDSSWMRNATSALPLAGPFGFRSQPTVSRKLGDKPLTWGRYVEIFLKFGSRTTPSTKTSPDVCLMRIAKISSRVDFPAPVCTPCGVNVLAQPRVCLEKTLKTCICRIPGCCTYHGW